MSLEKRFQEQFREHRINPSAMPWERIEAELDKSKKRPVFVIYSRWAAAASVALLITAYANWNHLPMGSNLAAAKEKAAQQNTTQEANTPEVKIDVTTIAPLTQNTNTQSVIKNIRVVQHHNNQVKPMIQQSATPESLTALQAEIQKNTAASNVPITKRNIENTLVLSNRSTAELRYSKEDIALDLPVIPAPLLEKNRINKKWKTYLNEEISEDSDSTLTERTLVMVDQKTRTFVQRTWKPMLKEFFRLRKGF
jgi:hypothetical protein